MNTEGYQKTYLYDLVALKSDVLCVKPGDFFPVGEKHAGD